MYDLDLMLIIRLYETAAAKFRRPLRYFPINTMSFVRSIQSTHRSYCCVFLNKRGRSYAINVWSSLFKLVAYHIEPF